LSITQILDEKAIFQGALQTQEVNYTMPREEINPAKNEANELLKQIDPLEENNIQEKRANTNILIVDDEEIMRNLLSDVLEEEGYKVSSLACAEDALKIVTMGEADIIITDIKMKGMDGMELLKKTREISPNTDVIVMTGYASIQTAVESMKLGAIDYLNKPLNIDQIRVIVNKASEQRSIKGGPKNPAFIKSFLN